MVMQKVPSTSPSELQITAGRKVRPTRYPAFQIHNRKSSENHRLLSAAFCYKKKIHPVIPSLPGNTFTYTVFLQRHNPFNYEKLKHVLAIDLSDKSFLALHTYQNLGPWSFHLVMVLHFVLCIFLAFLELVPSWTKIFYVWVHIKMFKIASSMDVKARIKRFDLHLHNLLIKISLSPPHHIHFEARTQEPPPVHSKAIPTLLHN